MNLPKLTDEVERDIVHSIIDAVSRPVIFKTVTQRVLCPVCAGTDPFCPTCNGNGTVDTVTETTLSASVRWKGSDDKVYKPNGQDVAGDCTLVLAVTPSGGVLPTAFLLEKVTSVVVDGRTCVIDKWYFKGSPTNRAYVVLKQDTSATQRIG